MTTIYEIPLTTSPDKTYTVSLDDTRYDLRVKYIQRLGLVSSGKNTKADEFVLELSYSGGTPFIITSLKTNRNILQPYRYLDGCPSGSLILLDSIAELSQYTTDGKVYNPERVTYDDLGTRFRLYYLDYEED